MSDAPKITLADIIEAVSAHYGVSAALICSPRRESAIVHARHVVCWLARTLTHQSFASIGRRLGDRDHATIIYCYGKIEEMRADPAFREEMDGIEAAIRAVAELRERKIMRVTREIDPYAVARRVLEAGDRAAGMVTIAEITAMCAALDAVSKDLSTDTDTVESNNV